MSRSRTRDRFAALVAAVPVVIAVGPYVAPAYAVDSVRTAALAKTAANDYRIGPNAGFRGDVAHGVDGHTAIFAFDVSPAAAVETVTVLFKEDGAFGVYGEFDETDGFQLYKDLNGNDRLDANEYAAGPVSQPKYGVGGDGQNAVITVDGGPDATGAGTYLLTVHPATTAINGRKLTFGIPANGVDTTTGNTPATALSVTDIYMDTAAPALIPSTNFEPVNRTPQATCPAGAPADSCGLDGYKVTLGATPVEPAEKIGFFNTGSSLDDSALLVVAGQQVSKAVYDVVGLDADDAVELSIGNGTGRDLSSATPALNNQTSDDVWAQQWDEMGNVTGQVLTNTPPPPCGTPPCPVFVPRGNDVTAPSVTWSVTMGNVTAASTLTAVPVTGTVSSTDAAVPAGTAQTAIAQLATPQHVQPIAGTSSYTVQHTGDEARSASTITPSATPTPIVTNVDVHDTTKFPQDAQIRATARLVDVLGNASVPKETPVVLKDTLSPSLLKASLIDANTNGQANTGEEYRISFDDPMDPSKITNATLATRLALTSPSPCGGTSATFTDEPLCVSWGNGATVAWSGGNKLLTITLGTVCAPNDEPIPGDCTNAARLPQAGDTFTADTNVTDPAGNVLLNRANFVISAPAVLAYSADTVDASAANGDDYATGRDGVLDAVDVKFTGNLNAASVATAAAKTPALFSVSVGGTSVPLTGVSVIDGASNDVIRLAFDVPAAQVPFWRTGARPDVALKNDPATSTTHVTDSSGNPIPAFAFQSNDKVAPIPLSIETKDDGDGHIDTAVVTYTEGIDQASQNPCGYTVAGYGDQAYGPANAETTSPATSTPKACPATPTATSYRNKPTTGASNDVVVLALKPLATYDTNAAPAVRYDYNNTLPPYKPNTSEPGTTLAPDCADQAVKTPGTASITASCPIKDAAGNTLNAFSGFTTDGAGPAVISRSTADADGDGHLDRIDVAFSENLSTPSLGAAQFEVTNPVYTIKTISGSGPAGIAISLTPTTGLTGDTGVTPTLKFLGGTKDLADPANSSPADGTGVVVADKAGPALMKACSSTPTGNNGTCPVDSASNDQVNVFFSEAATDVAATDFTVEQGGVDKPVTAASAAGDGKSVTLTVAEASYDSATDGVVRLKTAGAIKDAATNPSTQTANVTISRIPAVALDISCPTPANPGYCGSTVVNTGAAGAGLITGWRLSETPRTATPPESEFSPTQPTVYPTTGALPEGEHTLYLSGKDDFGRLSTEVSDTVTILKDPKILNVQWVDATPPKPGAYAKTDTVLDGDVVKIGADAYGTDAASWAANNAPVGGNCLVQNLKINLSGLVGDGTKTAVKPNACDLKTNTEQPYRQLQWTAITAAGTTKYPVGTVLRTPASGDTGSLIVDGPNGTQLRRQFISVNARRSWQITDASVIVVPASALSKIAKGSNLGYRDGSIVKAAGTGYYYVSSSVKRPVSTATLAYWKIPTTTAYTLSSAEMAAMPTLGGVGPGAHPVGVWIKFANGSIQQVTRRGDGTVVRRALANSAALKTLVPTSQIFAANAKDGALPLDSFLRGYRDGTVLKLGTTGYGVVSRASLRRFASPEVFNSLGYATSNALSANGLAMPRVNGQTYRTGTVIDRYKITSIVITVTNTAGNSATATVKPTIGGIYGVGTLDPAPLGWDNTRQWS